MYDIDIQLLKELVPQSSNLTQLAYAFGFSKYNTRARNYLKALMVQYNLAFSSQVLSQNIQPSILLEKLLVVTEQEISSNFLKSKLLKENLLENKCMMAGCSISGRWNNKTINLHLDHKNGNKRDNRLENLRLLCPNCHSQTDTYTGRNNKLGFEESKCARCGEISKSGKFCTACIEPALEEGLIDSRVTPEIELTILLKDVAELGISGAARKYNRDRGTIGNYVKLAKNGGKLPKTQKNILSLPL